MRVEDGFQIVPYPQTHPFTDDPVLPRLLQRLVPQSYVHEIEADLVRFGNEIKDNIRLNIPSLMGPPRLIQYDQWGRRIDRLETSEGWRKLKDIAIREGIVAIAHERKYGEYSRVYGFMKAAVFSPDSYMIMCPMAMTDGAARVLELYGTKGMKNDIRSRLISREPSFAITSGQWMTERPGGSDVSQTETKALPKNVLKSSSIGTPYTLDGFKWFSSATDAQVSVALARTGSLTQGTRGLSLFLVPLRLPLFPLTSARSTSNGILVHRLKDKFGTHTLATAELSLNDTEAYLLSPLNQGIRCMTPILNITRVHSAVGIVASLGRAFAIARSYATVRTINVSNSQGQSATNVFLKDVPLHTASLARIGTTYEALAHLVFDVILLLGKSECGTANPAEDQILRLLTPVIKGFASESGGAAVEECMSCLGGQGYMEENVIPRLIRDAAVEKIWEGTISIMALDMVRASKHKLGIKPFVEWCDRIIRLTSSIFQEGHQITAAIGSVKQSLVTLSRVFESAAVESPFVQRPLLFLTAQTAAAVSLLKQVTWAFNTRASYPEWPREVTVFIRWVDEGLAYARVDVEKAVSIADLKKQQDDNSAIVYGPRKCSVKL